MADNPQKKPHATPGKSLVDKVIDLALGAGGGAVTLLSGLLAAVLILYSGYVLYDSFATERAASSSAWDLLQFKPEILDDTETPLSAPELAKIIKDYRAWLTVYDTNIDYPVVQYTNDLYYASHDVYQNNSLTGAIYLAAGNNPDFSDSYNVIYGHHMDSSAMFGGLDKMTGSETGVIVTGEDIYDVQFFAVVKTDAYENRIYNVGNRMDDVLAFLRSGGEGGVGVGTEVVYFNEEAASDAERLVALSTCASAVTSGRLVVIGKMTKRIVMKDITVTKVWDDEDNQDGIRPASLTLTASDGTEAVLTEENEWTATVSVRKFDNLGEVCYTWEEKNMPAGYTVTGNVTNGDETTITNRHEPAIVSASVHKVWIDDDNRDGIRPESLSVALSDGQHTVTLSEANGWTAGVENLPKYSEGKEIAYTWTEAETTGYTLTSSRTEGMLTTLTNTHVPATAAVSVEKIWEDGNNRDGIRSTSVTASLYGNGKVAGTVTLTAENNWKGSIDGLLVYEKGQPIDYRWTEESVPEGYVLTVSEDGKTLTNTHTPAVKALTVTKIWDDNDNQDGVRPASLWVSLNSGLSVELNEANRWTETVEGLPVYDGGQEIEYTWTETGVTGYTLTGAVTNGSLTTLTNRHETDTTVATVVKEWDDDGNRDGIRPSSIDVILKANGREIRTEELSEKNGWTATASGLDLNEDGKAIAYTWAEPDTEGYTSSQSVNGTTTTITNTHKPETKALTVCKSWNDQDNQDGIRPSSVTAILLAGSAPVQRITLSAENEWSGTVEDLPVYGNGAEISYTWTEENVEGYTPESRTEGNVTTLVNTHEPETFSLTALKVWDDDHNRDGIRPASVTAALYADGEKLLDVELKEENGWSAAVDGLDRYSDGVEIEYSWQEENVPEGYTSSVENNIITNTHIPAAASLRVVKIWDDDEDRDRIRPSTLKVMLLADGVPVPGGEKALNETNGWTAEMENLPVYANGQKIVYTWKEEEVNGYTVNSAEEGTVTTLTNTHQIDTLTLTILKIWDDDDNRDGIRPETLTVTLLADGKEAQTVDLSEQNRWSAAVTVPAKDRGTAIVYSWAEPRVSGYTFSQESDQTATTFINTHKPATTRRIATKVWDDVDDQDGVRPGALNVYLFADGDLLETYVLNEENEWTCTVEDLPVYDHGKAIAYTWREDRLEEYTREDGYPNGKTSTNGITTTFTNKREPMLTALTVRKVWDDRENHDGLRPDQLALTLLANGEAVQHIQMNEENGWTVTVEDLPCFAAGKEIVYSWTEEPVEGYVLTSIAQAGETTVLTNTHENETTVATVVKVWDDDDDRDGLRPSSLRVTLNADGQAVKTVLLNEDNSWTATVENLTKYNGEAEIVYTWMEEEINGYTANFITEGNTTTIINTHEIITAPITVVKVWDDQDNQDGIRPSRLYVTLSIGETVELNESNGWTATVNDLPVYAYGGRRIIYSWSEPSVEGYSQTGNETVIVEDGKRITTLTNTHEPMMTELTVKKVWRDAADPTARPLVLSVFLTGGDNAWRVTLDASNNWSASVTVPMYQNGRQIAYIWTEGRVNGYKGSMTTFGNVTTFINTRVIMPGLNPPRPVQPTNPDETIDEISIPLGLGQTVINVGDCLE